LAALKCFNMPLSASLEITGLRFPGFRWAALLVAVLALLLGIDATHAQVPSRPPTRRLITRAIDDGATVAFPGNTRLEANPSNDRGIAPDSLPIEHMQLQLRLPSEKEQELNQLIADLHNPASPNFHKWLTSEQFSQEFSLAPEDLNAITTWLQSHGFRVNVTYPRTIDFSGVAGQVRSAFGTEIHNIEVNGERHIANMSDPRIPAAMAVAVEGVVSMNDFMPRPLYRQRSNDTVGNGQYLVAPADLATIYNFNPLFANGISGQGQTIVVLEDSDVYNVADWSTFRTVLGLSKYTSASFTQVHPAPSAGTNNCTDPGTNGDDAEAALDVEWSSAGAPNSAIELISCTSTTTFGGFIALQNVLNSSGTPPGIVSISYGESEAVLGAANNAYINALYQQAVTEGVSIFVSSGDQGGASSDYGASNATHGISVSGFTSTPYNVSVGGTDFGDTYAGTKSNYWNSTNTAAYGSAKSYVPEIPWNDSCASGLLTSYFTYVTSYGSNGFCNSSTGQSYYLRTVAGSGGPSACATGTSASGVVGGSCAGYAKPSWQSLVGNPNDGVRDIPDVSLFAANGVWGHYYVVCYSDINGGGAPCTGNPNGWSGFGGTSISAPIMASVQALINQTIGSNSGNPNPTFYSLAASEYGSTGNPACNSTLGNGVAGSCIFYDVTQGDIDVNCTGSHNCYIPSGQYGVLSNSDSSYQPAFDTNTGWDFPTGIGTVNVANLVNGWPRPSNPAALTITKMHSGNFTQGQQNALYTVIVSNGASAGPTIGTVTVTEIVPSGLTLVSLIGNGWTCAASSCTRGDSLIGGSSYPAITVTVNVATSASSPQVNSVSLSGGGSKSASTNDSTVISAASVAVASFLGADALTQGSWQGKYGVDGYSIADSNYQHLPGYATVAAQNQMNWMWASATADPRALTIPGGTTGIASCWFNNPSFNFDVTITDGNSHQIALYALDWDNLGRAETIQIVDAATNNVLSTQSISSFNAGTYLLWTISGHVKINVTLAAGANAVVSGLFFK
jgi:uncharacterized repeat protein (TIGR01451 family)